MAQKKAEVTEIDGGLEFTFTSGETLTIQFSDITQDVRDKAESHGFKQKIADSYAGADPEDAYAAAKGVVDRLANGEWTKTREGGGGGAKISQLAEAVAEVMGIERAEAVEKVSGLDDERKKELRAHPQVKQKLLEIKARRASEAAERAAAEAADAGELSL